MHRRLKSRGVTLNIPTDVMTTAPGGSARPGRGLAREATVHCDVAEGQVTQPFLLQMSISPLSFTDHAHREPFAVLSMHIPTAVRPSVAEAEPNGAISIAATAAKSNFRILQPPFIGEYPRASLSPANRKSTRDCQI
jgi:hypothetical protein